MSHACQIASISSVNKAEARRYSRQLILPELGVHGFKKLRSSKVLVIGAGGLGTSACMHLAANGVGTLGIVDYDIIEESNLPRQITYRRSDVGRKKVEVLAEICRQQNPADVCVLTYDNHFTSDTALDILLDARISTLDKHRWNVVLDCVDNAATRYLLNDLCSAARIPFVSGAALKWEGQLTTFMFDGSSPCRRCWWPAASGDDNEQDNADSNHCAGECAEFGVFGPVPGLIGTLQAIEGLKICSGMRASFTGGKLLIYDATDANCAFRVIRMPTQRADSCRVCAARCEYLDNNTADVRVMIEQALTARRSFHCDASLTDNANHNGTNSILSGGDTALPNDKSLRRLSPQQVVQLALASANAADFRMQNAVSSSHATRDDAVNLAPRCAIVDVRPQAEMEICSLPCSLNLPFQDLLYSREESQRQFVDFVNSLTDAGNEVSTKQTTAQNSESACDRQRVLSVADGKRLAKRLELIILCRRGNDSQLAYPILVDFIRQYSKQSRKDGSSVSSVEVVGDMIGGLDAWPAQVDESFPMY